MEIVNRDDARARGLKRYFTGQPCKRGHLSERHVSNQRCIACANIGKRERDRKYREANREKLREGYRRHYYENHEKRRAQQIAYYAENREQCIQGMKARYYANHEAELAYRRRWRQENREANNRYFRERRRNDPVYGAKCTMRAMVKRCLTMAGVQKTSRTEEYLGYTAAEFREHMERQFAKGMGWHNRSEWHIDHITPIAWFLENGITDPRRINCLSNLKPVWARENLSKNARQTHLI